MKDRKLRPSTIGALVLALFVLGLCATKCALGIPPPEPDIRVINGTEGIGFVGLTGAVPCSSQYGAATVYAWDGVLMPLQLNVELINVGRTGWCPSVINPGSVTWYQFAWWWEPIVHDAVRISLTNANGIAATRTCDLWWFMWDYYSFCSFCTFGDCFPGLSAGAVGIPWGDNPAWNNCWLDVAGVPAGDYALVIEFDPLNQWGQHHTVSVPCGINMFDFWWR